MSTVTGMMRTICRCNAFYRDKFFSDELPGIYHSYVFAICNHPGWSQDRLAKHLCFGKSTVTRHLTYLEENGYCERKTSPADKRETLVYPTDKMLEILPRLGDVFNEWNAALTDGISEEELELFKSVLVKLSQKSREIIYGSGEVK